MNSILKILWIAPYPSSPTAHAAPWVTSLANALGHSGEVELTILSTSATIATNVHEVQKEKYRVVLVKTPPPKLDILSFYRFRISALRSWLSQHEKLFDIIHVHGTEHQYEVASLGSKVPVVVSIQGLLHQYYPKLPETISSRKLIWMLGSVYERAGIRKHKNFICRTHWDTSSVLKINPAAQILTGWEMIRPQFFQHPSLPFYENKNLLFLGGLNNIKGIEPALLAFDQILETQVLELIILGDGNVDQLGQLVSRLALKNVVPGKNVHHRGRVGAEGIVAAMKQSALLLHPSFIDNSPNSICEAQVMGLPVVASDVGGVSSLITDKQTGILTTLDPGSIVEGIKLILNDRTLAKNVSQASRELASARHNSDTILKDYLNIYRKLLA